MVEPTTPAHFERDLDQWLHYLEGMHPQTIALGLERVSAVREKLDAALRVPVITVGGTNGKGSTCTYLEKVLEMAGYHTGLYTSPHLLRYNERVRVAGRPVSDGELCAAFHAVELARRRTLDQQGHAVRLTFFEFGTLAALWLFSKRKPDVVILEVGLGGRLDAVNCIDPDVAVVTGVAIDHAEYLGNTREAIGREKAGIFRGGRPAVCGEADPPTSVLDAAKRCRAGLYLRSVDFDFAPSEARTWHYWSRHSDLRDLPLPGLLGSHQLSNAACAIAAIEMLRGRLPVSHRAIRNGITSAQLPGRFQMLECAPMVVCDVAHNPQAAQALARSLEAVASPGRTIAVFGCMKDKDIAGIITAMRDRVSRWFVASLASPRGASSATLSAALRSTGVSEQGIGQFDDIAAAFKAAHSGASREDVIVVFGSFLAVAPVLETYRSPTRMALATAI